VSKLEVKNSAVRPGAKAVPNGLNAGYGLYEVEPVDIDRSVKLAQSRLLTRVT